MTKKSFEIKGWKFSAIIFFVVILLVSLALLYLKGLSILIAPLFADNFEEADLWEYLLIFIIASLFSFVAFIVLDAMKEFLKKKGINSWLGWMFIVMIFCLFLGAGFIEKELRLDKEIHFALKDADKNLERVGRIDCTDDNDKKVYVDEQVYCNISPKLSNITGQINQYSHGLLKKTTELKDEISFKALDDITYISFEIQGYDETNKYRRLSIAWIHTFLTNEIIKNNQKQVWKYFFGLLSLIFVLVPTALASIKSLAFK